MHDILLVSGFFFTALIQGISGFGNAIGNNAFLTKILDISVVSPLVACISLLLNITMLSRQNNLSHHPELKTLLGWSLLGTPFGILLLQSVPHQQAIIIIVCLLCILLFIQIYSQYYRMQLSGWLEKFVCFCAGIFGFAYNVAGVFIALYILSTNLEKQRSIVLTATYFLIMNIINISIFRRKGYLTPQVLQYFTISAPWVIFGGLVGTYLNVYISQRVYMWIIRGFLVVSIVLMVV